VQYKKVSSPTSISDGTNSYNGTAESGQASGLTADTHYYFSAWAWVKAATNDLFQWSDTYVTWDIWTKTAPPLNMVEEQSLGNYTLDLSWTKYDNSYRTIVLRNASGYVGFPSTITNGTVIYNNTGLYYIDTATHKGVTYRYSAWSYNSTRHTYSTEYDTIYGTPIAYGIDISIDPSTYAFGTIGIPSIEKTTGKYFTLTNSGNPVDIEIEIGNSENWTFVNYSARGHDTFSMNYSTGDWITEYNIPTTGGLMATDLAEDAIVEFDLKVLTPTSITSLTHKENWIVTFTATPS
jgi:hypothetical protein